MARKTGQLSTTITLNDEFSKKLNAINSSIRTTIGLMDSVNKVASKTGEKSFKSLTQLSSEQLKYARQQLVAQSKLDTIEAQRKLNAERVAGQLDIQNKKLEVQQALHRGIFGQLRQWATKLRTITTLYLGIRTAMQSVGNMVKLSDKMTMNNAKMRLITKDEAGFNDLEMKTFAAAQRSTTDYMEFTKAVGKLGILAGDKFKNNDSIVKFVELMNKSFQISGAETSERNAAMLQITQAIASNRLQGDEFRSILENAPMVMEALVKSLGVGHDKLKAMAKEGQITADVLIKAMFDAGEKIENMYKELPMTWERHWAKLKNVGVQAFKPVQKQLESFFNSKKFQKFIDNVCTAMIVLGNLMGIAFRNFAISMNWISEKFNQLVNWIKKSSDTLTTLRNAVIAVTIVWGIYKGVQMAIVAWSKLQVLWTTFITVAKTALITALLVAKLAMFAFGGATGFASTMTAILEALLGNLAVIIGVVLVAALAVLIFWIFQTSDNWIDACSRIVGGVYWIWEGLKWLWDCVKVIGKNIGIAFNNGWSNALSGFWKFVKGCLEGVKWLEPAINAVAKAFGAEGFTLSGTITDVEDKIRKADAMHKNYESLPVFNGSDAYNKGYGKTEKFLNKAVNKYDEFTKQLEELKKVEIGGQKLTADALNGIDNTLGDVGGKTAENTGKTADNTSKSTDYSYLRDWTYQKGLGNSIGYNIKIEQNNRNNVASSLDVDKIANALIDKVVEGLNMGREGVIV